MAPPSTTALAIAAPAAALALLAWSWLTCHLAQRHIRLVQAENDILVEVLAEIVDAWQADHDALPEPIRVASAWLHRDRTLPDPDLVRVQTRAAIAEAEVHTARDFAAHLEEELARTRQVLADLTAAVALQEGPSLDVLSGWEAARALLDSEVPA